MLDHGLAALYNVETKNLNKAVRRNLDRFPAGFTFQLTLLDAIRELAAPPIKPRREIGFHAVGKNATDGGTTKSKRK